VYRLRSRQLQHLQLFQSRAASLIILQLQGEEWLIHSGKPLNRHYRVGQVLVAAHRRPLVKLALLGPLTRAHGLC
jgi:hypothetical protein